MDPQIYNQPPPYTFTPPPRRKGVLSLDSLGDAMGGGGLENYLHSSFFGGPASGAAEALPGIGPSMSTMGAPGLSELGIANAGDVSGLASMQAAPTGIGAAGNFILPAAGALGAYDVLSHNYGPGRGALEGAASGAAIGSFFPGPGTLIGAGVGGAIGLGKGLMKHKTTREVAQGNTKKFQSQAPGDATWQNYVNSMRSQYNAPPPDPKHPFHAGQYGSWNEYKKAGLDAADLTGVKGNMDVFGPEWSHLNLDQQKKITQALIDNDLYNSRKGEVDVTDSARAKQLGADVLGGKYKSPVAPGAANNKIGGALSNVPVPVKRSGTSSPGIDLQGRRITYSIPRSKR